MKPVRIRLVKGADDTIRGDAVRDLTNELLGDLDAGFALDRVEGDDYEIATAVDAAQTAPFLTDRRVVVVRHLGRFNVDDLAPVLQYLADPLPSTELILVWERGSEKGAKLSPVPKKLTEAVTAAEVQELANELFQPERLSLALIGPYTDSKPFSDLLNAL